MKKDIPIVNKTYYFYEGGIISKTSQKSVVVTEVLSNMQYKKNILKSLKYGYQRRNYSIIGIEIQRTILSMPSIRMILKKFSHLYGQRKSIYSGFRLVVF